MLNKVLNYINKFNMIKQGDRIVLGVSGGADSVCLLHVLGKLYKDCDITLITVHVNHGIRGEEAARDEQFVRDLCSRMGVEFFAFSYDVKQLAVQKGLTEEEAGRNVRYETFLEVCKQQKCNKIAVAHNRNDSAETFLFNLFRGSGMKGLSGIEPSRSLSTEFGDVTLVRPLLCVERNEIEAYLGNEEFPYQTDSTNLMEDYSRNKIRNRILNYAVAELNSGTVGNINETAAKLREAFEFIDSKAQLSYQEIVNLEANVYIVALTELEKEAFVIQKAVIRKVLEKLSGKLKDLEAKHIDSVITLSEKQVGKYVNLPYGMIAERGYKDIRIFCVERFGDLAKSQYSVEPMKLTVPGSVKIPQTRMIFEVELIKYEKNVSIPKSSCMKWFDYDKIENAVEIRNRKEGDYIQINRLGGRKKLKDYFIDHKIPKKQRDSQILITDGSHVMWIPGNGGRVSEKYKVDDSTTNVLLMKMIILEESKDDR